VAAEHQWLGFDIISRKIFPSNSNQMSTRPVVSVQALVREISSRLDALPVADAESIRAVRREFSKRLVMASAKDLCAVAVGLLGNPTARHRLTAYELVSHHRPALASLEIRDLERLGQGLSDWSAVDTFAIYLAGPAWRQGQISDARLRSWARSRDRWWRRAALVATVPLNNKTRGGKGDPTRTLAICQMLVADRDDMVVKGMSWALRELAKREPSAVERFLEEFEETVAPRVLREVRNKLRTGLKNPRPTKG
jgi:3-methyladenine DNA glycosylase AlkD